MEKRGGCEFCYAVYFFIALVILFLIYFYYYREGITYKGFYVIRESAIPYKVLEKTFLPYETYIGSRGNVSWLFPY